MNPQRIATELKRDPTTIRRELQRGGGIGAYNPEWAQKRYQHKRSQKRTPYRFKAELYDICIQLLKKTGLEPARIGPRLCLEYGNHMNISHMTVYRHIYQNAADGGRLYTYLRTGRKKAKKT